MAKMERNIKGEVVKMIVYIFTRLCQELLKVDQLLKNFFR